MFVFCVLITDDTAPWAAGTKLKPFKFLISRAKRLARARVFVDDGRPATDEGEGETEPLLVHVARVLVGNSVQPQYRFRIPLVFESG